jgi:hypothetical protein
LPDNRSSSPTPIKAAYSNKFEDEKKPVEDEKKPVEDEKKLDPVV